MLNSLHRFDNIQHAFSNLHLLFNTKKTEWMLFNQNLPQLPCPPNILALNGSELKYVDTYKYLGIGLHCSLSFHTDVTNLQFKVRSRIGFLYRNKISFARSSKEALVKMTILLVFFHGNIVYRLAPKTDFADFEYAVLPLLPSIYSMCLFNGNSVFYLTVFCCLLSYFIWQCLCPLAGTLL